MICFEKKEKEAPQNRIILGMVLLRDTQPLDFEALFQDFQAHYDYTLGETAADGQVAVFDIDAHRAAVSFLPVPVPWQDLENAAGYAYNWPEALTDLQPHQAHIIVSILSGEGPVVDRFTVFTRLICSLLRTTNAIGVYKGGQSLLIPKADYLEGAEVLKEEDIPLHLWIYIGMRSHEGRNSAYTYGLKEFGKTEMEILDSANELSEVANFLICMAHYVVEQDVEFKDGETCGFSEDQRIGITYSSGRFIEDRTFKLAY